MKTKTLKHVLDPDDPSPINTLRCFIDEAAKERVEWTDAVWDVGWTSNLDNNYYPFIEITFSKEI
ncbi:MAG: hypothetical protein J6X18_13400 [Bacteroidales bacterium]|nr:hypothetical protein [Bacteroidales bacterium]